MKTKCEHKWKMKVVNSGVLEAFRGEAKYVLSIGLAQCEICDKAIDEDEINHHLNEYSAMKRELKIVKEELDLLLKEYKKTFRKSFPNCE